MDEVKIVYCKDSDGKIVYYSDTIPGNKYYCLDCGEELVIKNGQLKVKHLSHKSNSSCNSSGESYIHNHYKKNMFIPGMVITTRKGNAVIERILIEEEIGKYYQKKWNRKIFPDVLLVTNEGDVAIEFNYSNKKKWKEYIEYYKELNLLDIFEIDICENINSVNNLVWRSAIDEFEKIEAIKNFKPHNETYRFFVGRFNAIKKVYGKHYKLECLTDFTNNVKLYQSHNLKKCTLSFHADNEWKKESRLIWNFPQPWISSFSATVVYDPSNDYYEVQSFYNPKPFNRQMVDTENDNYADLKLPTLLKSRYPEEFFRTK